MLARSFELRIRLPTDIHEVLRLGKAARNDLAHFDPLTPARVEELFTAANNAGF